MAANISGGQSLALSLAIVLSLYDGVAYLILDEPSAGADKKQVGDIAQMIKTAAAQSCGVLMVEQDINLLTELADRVYECRDGTLQKSETS
jgi:energy-coupling factor transporter ATP-binding protein EcfA2